MKGNDRPTQLGLFVEPGQEEEALVGLTCDSVDVHPNLIQVDVEALCRQLLTLGAKHHYPAFSFPYVYPRDNQEKRWGLLWRGKVSWKRSISDPNQRDRYPGEWLEKAVEQIKRYDSGADDIPGQITHIADDRE